MCSFNTDTCWQFALQRMHSHSYQWFIRVPASPYPWQHRALMVYWCSIYISLAINEINFPIFKNHQYFLWTTSLQYLLFFLSNYWFYSHILCILGEFVASHSSTLAWKSHGWRSLVSYSPWGLKELDTTERLHFNFSLSCTGEGNGNPLQCSCLENPSLVGCRLWGRTELDTTEAT